MRWRVSRASLGTAAAEEAGQLAVEKLLAAAQRCSKCGAGQKVAWALLMQH